MVQIVTSDERKLVRLFRNDPGITKVQAMRSNLRKLYQLSSMVVLPSCSGIVLLPVVMVYCDWNNKNGDYFQILQLYLKPTARALKLGHNLRVPKGQ